MDRPAVFIPFLWLLFFLAIPLQARQLALDENFESHDLSNWTGDTGHFIFSDDSGNTLLQLDAPGAGTTQIQTASNVAYGSWEFFIDQDFSPSNNNRGFIFLISDREDLTGDVNGYAIRTGENLSGDTFRLLRFDNGNSTEILAGASDLSSGGPFQVRIIREDDGTWHLYESAEDGIEPVLTGTTVDNKFTTSEHFGILLNYTSSNSDKFYFDDIKIEFPEFFNAIKTELHSPSSLDIYFNYPVEESPLSSSDFSTNQGIGSPQEVDLISDFSVRLTYSDPFPDGNYSVTMNNIDHTFGGKIAPGSQQNFSVENPFYITDIISSSNQQITLKFTEEVDDAVVKPANFTLPGAGSPHQALQSQPGTVLLEYNSPIAAGDYELSISGLQSINGWPLAGSNTFGFFIYDDYQEGDLHISEFFYRPPTSWRTAEFDRPRYVEIYNSSNRILNLRNWLLNDENISPNADVPIHPEEYLVLTRGESVFRNKFGSRNFAEAENFPDFSLTTDNKVVLKSPENSIADSLHYDAGLWGGNGFSLERYSFDVPARFRDNWSESEDALFGSPGVQNTIQPPQEPPVIENIEAVVPGSIQVTFSAAISNESVNPGNFSMDHGISFTDTEFFPADKKILVLETSKKLEDGQNYLFFYENVEDIFGNKAGSEQQYDFLFLNPFKILTAEVKNGNNLIIEFTRPLNISTIDAADFKLPDNTAPLSLDILNSKKVRFHFDNDFTIGKHSILARNFESINGWKIGPNASSDFYVFEQAEPNDIVINEILYRRLETGSPEFVEIINRSKESVSLSGWTLWDDGNSADILGNIILQPGDYLAFTDTEPFASDSDQIIYLPGFPSLNNNGDAVVLKNSSGIVIDSVYYQPEWGNNSPGISLERKDPAAVSADPSNWIVNRSEDGSTPAAENSRFKPDETPPQIIFANLFHPDSLEIHFSEFIDLTQELSAKRNANSLLPRTKKQSLKSTNPGMIHPAKQTNLQFSLNGNEAKILRYDPGLGNRVILDASGVGTGKEVIIEIKNFRDFQGNVQPEQTLPVAQPAAEGDLVLNEIMYDPIADGQDDLPDQTDYIEIYNRQPYALSLEGIYLHDEPDENNQVSPMKPVTTTGKWIPGNGYALLYPESEISNLQKTSLAEFFEITKDIYPFSIRFDRTSLSLPQAGRKVYLADSTGTIFDMADYRPEWHNPNLIDTKGISLERIQPDMETNDASNWGSNTSPAGGTPGTENSLYQDFGQPHARTGISFEPNPFSPDNDGYDDNLFIHYSFEEPDYLLRIRIYDRYGRQVRKLEDGKQAGFQGTVIWDGRTDNGSRNRIGIYIIYAEAYNSSNGKNLTFKETVVLARQF